MCAVSTAMLWPFRCELVSLPSQFSFLQQRIPGPFCAEEENAESALIAGTVLIGGPVPLIATGGDESIRSGGEDGG